MIEWLFVCLLRRVVAPQESLCLLNHLQKRDISPIIYVALVKIGHHSAYFVFFYYSCDPKISHFICLWEVIEARQYSANKPVIFISVTFGTRIQLKINIMAKVKPKWSYLRPKFQLICLFFVSWQSDHFCPRYSKFFIWPWKLKVNVMTKVTPNDPIRSLALNRYVCFLFRGNRTICAEI